MDKVDIVEYQNLSEPVRVTVVTGLLNIPDTGVPKGGKKGQNLTKKSDSDFDTYWADPDDINSIEHITLNGEDVPVEDKTANIKVDAKTIGLESTNVAYTDKVNTFTERQKFNIPSTNPDDTWYHGYIDASAVNISKTKYDGGIETGRTTNYEAILTSESLKLKRQINTQNGSTQYLIQLDHDGIKKAEYVNHVLANYRYLFPKTYPNKEVTLATIEDLTAQFGALNIENGTGTGSLVQKRLKSDGVTWTTTKAYQGASTALGGGTQAGRTEEEFNAYFWDSVNNIPLHDGQGKDSNGNILDNYGSTYAQSYSFALATGDYTKALGRSSHAEGNATQAIGIHSHAEGLSTKAEGFAAHTEGTYTEAYAKGSHAEGDHTKTYTSYQHVAGTYNDCYKYNALYIVGNGTSETDRRNAFEVLVDGRAKVQSAPIESDDVVRKQELDNYWNEFNLENGTGLDSIVQKYSGTVDETHFASSTTGERDVCLGEANKSSGKRNIIGGKLNENTGHNNLIGGLFNVCKSNHCLISGEGINVGEDRKHKGAIGRYNVDKPNTLFEVGNGNNNVNRSNAFEVLLDGRAKVQTAPKDNDDVVRKLELDTKYDKTGGTIGGNVIITGDLTVNGTQHINNTENLNVENAMIYSNAKGATLALLGGIGIKKDATDVYGIVYDPTSDSVKLGLGKSNANGVFTFNENEGQPVAIRDDSSKFTNNNLVKWDSTNHKFVDSGKKIDDLIAATNLENGTGDVLIQTTDSNQSFKVMTDGRAKVQSAPAENDDVLRLNELSVLTQEQVNSLF